MEGFFFHTMKNGGVNNTLTSLLLFKGPWILQVDSRSHYLHFFVFYLKFWYP